MRSRSTQPPASEAPPAKTRARGGWLVIDEFARDGFHYRILRRPLQSLSLGARLTKREEQVLRYVVEGHSNKSIAYALGLSPSTVGVLIFRATAKLGARSRLDLLAAYLRSKRDTR